jgi:23S rRNA (uracil1939-C5)-methyltransferase
MNLEDSKFLANTQQSKNCPNISRLLSSILELYLPGSDIRGLSLWGMNKRKIQILEDVPFTDAGARGVGVARLPEGQVLFAKGVIPGDVARVRVVKKKKSYLEGQVLAVTAPSPDRIEAPCAHFGTCGGCSWQMLPYTKQLEYKAREVQNNLIRIGKVTPDTWLTIKGSEKQYAYRNKMEYSFSALRWLSDEEVKSGATFDQRDALGFHVPGMWDKVIDINHCLLQAEPANSIRNFVRDYALKNSLSFFHPRERQGFLRSLTLRNTTTGEWMVLLQFHYEDIDARTALLDAIAAKFPEITSLQYVINEKANDTIYDQEVICYKGLPYITETMPAYFEAGQQLAFRIGPKSFYQTNPEQAVTLYHAALEMAGIESHHTVYDLYTGTGTIALFMSRKAHKVIGIEGVPEAIEDAKINAQLNGIDNTHFFAGDMRKVLTEAFFAQHGAPDVIVTDPPRDGMHKDVVERLTQSGAPIIIYISCNSATQARDLELLRDHYKVASSLAVDMFPQTFHIENIVKLEKIK